MAQQAGADKPIWVTELGWSTDPARRDSVDEQTQAAYERQALALIDTQWSSFVPHSFVYTWAKPSTAGPVQPDSPERIDTARLAGDPGGDRSAG